MHNPGAQDNSVLGFDIRSIQSLNLDTVKLRFYALELRIRLHALQGKSKDESARHWREQRLQWVELSESESAIQLRLSRAWLQRRGLRDLDQTQLDEEYKPIEIPYPCPTAPKRD